MKNRQINISIVAMIFLMVFACDTNEDDLMQPYATGAVLPEITEIESSFYDILDINNAYVDFTVNVNAETAESITIEKTYKGTRTELGTFDTSPVVVRVTAEQAVADIDGVSVGDLELGDTFLFEVIVTSKSGLRTRSNVLIDAPVACKSDLAGNYSAITTGTEYYGSSFTYEYDTELTVDSDGVYVLPDLSGGMEPNVWGSPPVEATIRDICNVISLVNAPYSYEYFIDEGYVDGDGKIYIKWRNFWGENGETWLTPK